MICLGHASIYHSISRLPTPIKFKRTLTLFLRFAIADSNRKARKSLNAKSPQPPAAGFF
jgi:hypothetical protein